MRIATEQMNLNHLYYFYQFAKTKNIVRAANALGISQPSLSTQLKTFETNLGVKIFGKDGKYKVLTDAGNELLNHCEKIFKAIESAQSGLDKRKEAA